MVPAHLLASLLVTGGEACFPLQSFKPPQAGPPATRYLLLVAMEAVPLSMSNTPDPVLLWKSVSGVELWPLRLCAMPGLQKALVQLCHCCMLLTSFLLASLLTPQAAIRSRYRQTPVTCGFLCTLLPSSLAGDSAPGESA